MEQSYYTPQTSSVSESHTDALSNAASEFSRNVQDATGKLVSATEQFATVSTSLNTAVAEVKAASERAEEARRAAEAVQAKLERDYASLNTLMRELQERIGALAVLARPFSVDAEAASEPATEVQPASSFETASENSGEGSSEEASSAENAPSPAGWQGWQG